MVAVAVWTSRTSSPMRMVAELARALSTALASTRTFTVTVPVLPEGTSPNVHVTMPPSFWPSSLASTNSTPAGSVSVRVTVAAPSVSLA